MATARSILKSYFLTGKKPTQGQFAALIDSFLHLSEDSIAIANVANLSTQLATKATNTQVASILSALGALEDLETVDKTSFVAAINELKDLVGIGGGGVSEVFESDFVVSMSGGKTFMKWTNGQTVPAGGKTAVQLLEIGAQEAIAPNVYLSRAPTSIIFNQKDGVNISVNYSWSINSLGATLTNLKLERSRDNATWTSIFDTDTPPASPYLDNNVNAGGTDNRPIYYRLTAIDSEGLTAVANTNISFAYRSFLGYRSTDPANIADIFALGNSGINDGKNRTFTGITASAGNYTYYAYKASAGDLSNVILDGSSPILGAFTKIADITGVDEFGGAVTYRIYKSNATQAFSSNTLSFS
ncbi:MAG: hypothetical protein IE931_03285 [Sphingobacteriales bacterium]|nr:hypothetical protein [Sphingobacteriales bacterium]